MNCPNCNNDVADSTRYCPYCGAATKVILPPMTFSRVLSAVVVTIMTLPFALTGAMWACFASGMGTSQAIQSLPPELVSLLPAKGEFLAVLLAMGSGMLVFVVWIAVLRKILK